MNDSSKPADHSSAIRSTPCAISENAGEPRLFYWHGVKLFLAVSVFAGLAGCATDSKPRHASDRKWYQGEMDNEDRAFFLDSFFDGR